MMDFHKGRWRLALGRLVNLRYINRWITFSADLFVSLSVSLLGVLGMFSILHIRIGESDVLKVGLSSLWPVSFRSCCSKHIMGLFAIPRCVACGGLVVLRSASRS